MANASNGNTLYFDATGSLRTGTLTKIASIIVTATSANAIVALSDASTTALKMELRVATSGVSTQFDFSDANVIFPTGVNVTTLTNAKVSLVIKS